MLYFFLSITLVFLTNYVYNTDARDTSNIIGGYPVRIEDFPHQVAIMRNSNLWCGGSILTTKHVLTAAHCVYEAVGTPLTIHAGTKTWGLGGTTHTVISSVTYGPSENQDVAVLQVKEPFVFDSTRQPVKLFGPNKIAPAGKIATVSGWGITGDEYEISEFLMAVDVPIIDRVACNTSYTGKITAGEICAGTLMKDSCQGDSGGPLSMNGVQIGVVSMGTGCGDASFPGVYADISFFHDWIMSKIKA